MIFSKAGNLKTKLQNLPIEKDGVVLMGLVVLIILGVVILMADGYFFYTTTFKKKQEGVTASTAPILSGADIDEVLKLLDERKKQLERELR